VFSALGCEGISRIDFLIDADTKRAVLQRDQHAARIAGFLPVVRPPRTTGTITDLLARLIDRAERLRAMKRDCRGNRRRLTLFDSWR
jgi:hypothetical protein